MIPRWYATDPAGRAAWRAWRSGDIAAAERLATGSGPRARAGMLFRTAYVQGRYTEALAIDAASPDRARLALAAQALSHLNRPADAVNLLRRRGTRRVPVGLSRRAERPLRTILDAPAVLEFADHALAPYLPAVRATLDGHDILAHLDTGGTFIVMGTERAATLGLDLIDGGASYHGTTRTGVSFGLAGELRLGPVTLTNVPVEAMPTLRGAQDLIIIGTNVLQQFLSTVDYPAGRLRLAPRGTPPPSGTRVPFHLWADHFLMARGGFGVREDCTWFVDSGLVYVIGDDDRPPRQACLYTTAERYRSFGVRRTPPHFEADAAVTLGPLRRDRPFVATAPRRVPWASFGGIRVDGLLSHDFLKDYTWTIDFDRHEFTFTT